jgi:hypothetical protein
MAYFEANATEVADIQENEEAVACEHPVLD